MSINNVWNLIKKSFKKTPKLLFFIPFGLNLFVWSSNHFFNMHKNGHWKILRNPLKVLGKVLEFCIWKSVGTMYPTFRNISRTGGIWIVYTNNSWWEKHHGRSEFIPYSCRNIVYQRDHFSWLLTVFIKRFIKLSHIVDGIILGKFNFLRDWPHMLLSDVFPRPSTNTTASKITTVLKKAIYRYTCS